MNSVDLKELLRQLDACTKEVENNFAHLNQEQLNFSPENGSWSIGQCLSHIIKTNEAYFPEVKKNLSEGYRMKFWEKYSPFSTSIGKSMLTHLGADIKKKFKTPKIFSPNSKFTSTALFPAFSNHQKSMVELYQSFEKKSSYNSNITSPASKLITLPVSDLLKILVAHEQRHIKQAINVMSHPKFPK